MSDWNSAQEILDFAIANEEESARFYRELAAKVDNPGLREIFEGYAREEDGHKAKLEGFRASGAIEAFGKVTDLKIADYLVEVQPEAVLSYQDALILGMKREKAAFKLYTDLAAKTSDLKLKSTLQALAQEEAKHKLHFELEYDEKILTEN